MDPKNAYQFCLRCGNSLRVLTNSELRCVKCEYKQYINPIPSNAVIIENEHQEILLVKRKFAPKKGWWDLPGGFMHPNETVENSAIREIKEELGVDVAIVKLVGIYPDTYLYQNILGPTLTIVVVGKIIRGQIKPTDDVADFKFFAKKEVAKQKVAFKAVEQGLVSFLAGAY